MNFKHFVASTPTTGDNNATIAPASTGSGNSGRGTGDDTSSAAMGCGGTSETDKNGANVNSNSISQTSNNGSNSALQSDFIDGPNTNNSNNLNSLSNGSTDTANKIKSAIPIQNDLFSVHDFDIKIDLEMPPPRKFLFYTEFGTSYYTMWY